MYALLFRSNFPHRLQLSLTERKFSTSNKFSVTRHTPAEYREASNRRNSLLASLWFISRLSAHIGASSKGGRRVCSRVKWRPVPEAPGRTSEPGRPTKTPGPANRPSDLAAARSSVDAAQQSLKTPSSECFKSQVKRGNAAATIKRSGSVFSSVVTMDDDMVALHKQEYYGQLC